jgi:short-subunit dehydrogenase involved in D-alanine esterification of teichoic acids
MMKALYQLALYAAYIIFFNILPSISSLTMSPRRILVTGANTGIGLALTKQLVKDHGCHVYLGSRSVEKGEKAVKEVKRDAGDSVELVNIVSYLLDIMPNLFADEC